MRDHRKLVAFQLADKLVLETYQATRSFPKEELFGLTSQMRRRAVSIAANIVEGCGRESQNEYVHFLNISFGSLRELGYYIDLSHRLGYLNDAISNTMQSDFNDLAGTMTGLIRSLRSKSK